MAEETNQSVSAKFTEWQGLTAGYNKVMKIAVIASSVTALGWLLFFYKISQTSEMAMRYSDDAHASIGAWIAVLFVMSVVSAGILGMGAKVNKRVKSLSSELTAELRSQLHDADPARRSEIESQLRELGA